MKNSTVYLSRPGFPLSRWPSLAGSNTLGTDHQCQFEVAVLNRPMPTNINLARTVSATMSECTWRTLAGERHFVFLHVLKKKHRGQVKSTTHLFNRGQTRHARMPCKGPPLGRWLRYLSSIQGSYDMTSQVGFAIATARYNVPHPDRPRSRHMGRCSRVNAGCELRAAFLV